MLLTVSHIDKRYGDKNVLNDVSFSLEDGHRVAVVGQNGAGKSTLLKIIAGLEEADSGRVVLAKDRTLGYLPQEPNDEEETLFNYIQSSPRGPFPKHIVYTMFSGLAIPTEAGELSFAQVSGGQKTKALLIRLLLERPHIALFDEPTNNLDIPSLVWLEEYMKQGSQAALIVSHDPYFLKSVTDRLVEIDPLTKKVQMSGGSYLDYLERKEKDFERAKKKYKEALQERERLMKAYTDQNRSTALAGRDEQPKENEEKQGAHARKERAGQKAQGAARQLRRRAWEVDIPDKPIEPENFVIHIKARPAKENGEIKLEEVVFGYPGNPLFAPLSTTIPFGVRICVLGENGSGKSTFLRTLSGQQVPISGEIAVGSGLIFGDLMQHHEQLRGTDTVREFFEKQTRMRGEGVYHTLKRYSIEPAYIDKPATLLSPGARARVLFSVFEQNGVNALVLDEPTNHLDIDAISALVETLKTYEGTVVLATHNRWFLEKIIINIFYRIRRSEMVRVDDFSAFLEEAKKESTPIARRLYQQLHTHR